MRLLLAAVLLASPVHRGDFSLSDLRVTRGPSDAGCRLTVEGVTLEQAGACAVSRYEPNERYPVGSIGEAQFVARSENAYAGKLSLKAGAEVKPHQHDTSMEIVVIQSGRGTFSIDGGVYEVGAGDAVVIPKATVHTFVAGPVKVEAVQFYLPPGPEQRFRPKEKSP
jgi:quercetin dioxygenase-like cupin family protein